MNKNGLEYIFQIEEREEKDLAEHNLVDPVKHIAIATRLRSLIKTIDYISLSLTNKAMFSYLEKYLKKENKIVHLEKGLWNDEKMYFDKNFPERGYVLRKEENKNLYLEINYGLDRCSAQPTLRGWSAESRIGASTGSSEVAGRSGRNGGQGLNYQLKIKFEYLFSIEDLAGLIRSLITVEDCINLFLTNKEMLEHYKKYLSKGRDLAYHLVIRPNETWITLFLKHNSEHLFKSYNVTVNSRDISGTPLQLAFQEEDKDMCLVLLKQFYQSFCDTAEAIIRQQIEQAFNVTEKIYPKRSIFDLESFKTDFDLESFKTDIDKIFKHLFDIISAEKLDGSDSTFGLNPITINAINDFRREFKNRLKEKINEKSIPLKWSITLERLMFFVDDFHIKLLEEVLIKNLSIQNASALLLLYYQVMVSTFQSIAPVNFAQRFCQGLANYSAGKSFQRELLTQANGYRENRKFFYDVLINPVDHVAGLSLSVRMLTGLVFQRKIEKSSYYLSMSTLKTKVETWSKVLDFCNDTKQTLFGLYKNPSTFFSKPSPIQPLEVTPPSITNTLVSVDDNDGALLLGKRNKGQDDNARSVRRKM